MSDLVEGLAKAIDAGVTKSWASRCRVTPGGNDPLTRAVGWEGLTEEQRRDVRAGARAALAHLNIKGPGPVNVGEAVEKLQAVMAWWNERPDGPTLTIATDSFDHHLSKARDALRALGTEVD